MPVSRKIIGPLQPLFVYVDYSDEGIPYYVGQGNLLRLKIRKRNGLHKHVSKTYGFVRKVVLETTCQVEALDEEVRLIKELKTYYYAEDKTPLACNFTKGGDGTYGHKTEAHCKAISASMIGVKHDPERNRRKSERQKGKSRSEEVKAKLRKPKSIKRRPWTDEEKAAMSARTRERGRSEEHGVNLTLSHKITWARKRRDKGQPALKGDAYLLSLDGVKITMLTTQKFLVTNSFNSLLSIYGINTKPSKDFTKWSLNYDQILAKSGSIITDECRGLILRSSGSISNLDQIVGQTEVVARPMNRFYNSDDPNAANINWDSARVLSKLDGTMCLLYWDSVKDQWCVATRSVPEADVCFGDIPSPLKNNTFYELFMYSAQSTLDYMANSRGIKTVDYWLSLLDKSFTYIFELTTPINRVVVKYDAYRITLLCARETATGTYMHHERLHEIGVPVVDEWPLKTLQDIEDFLLHSDPAKVEGAVVVDSHNNRIKVKSKAWVLASRAKDAVTMSKRNALEVIINGQLDDILPLLDQGVADYLRRMQVNTAEYLSRIDRIFVQLKQLPDRKSFALAVQASGLWQTPMFVMYTGKATSTSDWLQGLSRDKKLTDGLLDVLLKEVDK